MHSAASPLPLHHPSSHSSQLDTLTWLRGLYRFCRPESTLGSVVMSSAIALALLPALPSDPIVFAKIIACVLAMSLWTIAGHGINQIYDLPVDRINKPDFPLPSGVMTVKQAWIVNITTGAIAAVLAYWSMPFWLSHCFNGFMTWASLAYSVPRFGSHIIRQNPWLTKLLGVSFRGLIFPSVGFVTVWQLTTTPSSGWVYLAFILTFAVLFCIGMNTFEDIPDMKGDLAGGYRSFALTLGAVRTAYICLATFSGAFLSLVAWMLAFPELFHVEIGLIVEGAMLLLFVSQFVWLLRSKLQPDGNGTKPFYTFLWRLYAVQYMALIVIFTPSQILHP